MAAPFTTCPKCGAEPGEACQTKTGKRVTKMHTERSYGPPFHGRTPRSVLEAPKLEPEVISEQHGFSRFEMRNPRIISLLSPPVRREAMMSGRNTPFRSGRTRKIRRGRMARFNH